MFVIKFIAVYLYLSTLQLLMKSLFDFILVTRRYKELFNLIKSTLIKLKVLYNVYNLKYILLFLLQLDINLNCRIFLSENSSSLFVIIVIYKENVFSVYFIEIFTLQKYRFRKCISLHTVS